MTRLVAALTAVAVAGCGSEPGETGNGSMNAVSPADPPITTPAQPAVGSGLSGASSGLVGTTSGFAVRDTAMARIIEIQADTLFAFDSDTLDSQAEGNLVRAASLVATAPKTGVIDIVGHSDAKGNDAYNLGLSERRADAVMKWLQARGELAGHRFRALGRGEAEPKVQAAETASDAQRAPNRRVEIVLPK